MKSLLAIVVSGALLALAVAADPTTPDRLLNVALATAWAQQDRGRGPDDREDRGNDRGRGNDDRDDDGDRGRGGRGGDRDDDRGRDDDRDRDDDRGRGRDRDDDRGRGGRDDDRDRDDDQGRGRGNDDRDADESRGPGNDDRDNDDDRGRGRDDDRNAGGGRGGRDAGGDDDRGGNDDGPAADPGGGDDAEPPGPGDDGDTEPPGPGGDGDADQPAPSDDPPASPGPDVDAPDDDGDGHDDVGGGNNDTGVIDADTIAELAERGADDELDGELGELASRFKLDDTETFDDDGFLARRGEIIALSTDPELSTRASALGVQVVEQEFLASLNLTAYRLAVPAASPIDGILARLRAQDPNGVFDRNHLYDGSAADSVHTSATSGAPTRALVSTAQGVTLGLIDTGVDVLHPALRGTHVEMRFFVDESRVLPESHGTAVVSLLVSPQVGVLPGAQLFVASVFYEDPRGGLLCEAQDLVQALDWLMQRRVPVINMSLSGPPNQVLQSAIRRAISAGHLIVAAVGNAGPASPPLYPAAYDGVIAVTAVDLEQHVYRRASRGTHVEFAALGVDVMAAAPEGLAAFSGTSFASPYVAALAAMEHRTLDAQKAQVVRERLRSNALDLGTPGRDEIYGFGLARPAGIATTASR